MVRLKYLKTTVDEPFNTLTKKQLCVERSVENYGCKNYNK